MKLAPHLIPRRRSAPAARARGFTLVEMLVTMALFGLLLAGLVQGMVFGLKMTEVNQAKVTRSDEARALFGKLGDEIRSAKDTWVGGMDSNGVFQAVAEGQPQKGGALVIYPTTNRTQYIVYYLNGGDQTFRRYTSAATTPVALANSVTNTTVFRTENFAGQLLSTRQSSRVIRTQLEFFQARGLSPSAEYFRLETAVTKRATD